LTQQFSGLLPPLNLWSKKQSGILLLNAKGKQQASFVADIFLEVMSPSSIVTNAEHKRAR
jgi:hypothetical protein